MVSDVNNIGTKAYILGVHCFYEGYGWEEVILKNKNTLSNAKGILMEYLNKELEGCVVSRGDEYFKDEYNILDGFINDINIARGNVMVATTLDELNGIDMTNSDVVSIKEVGVYV